MNKSSCLKSFFAFFLLTGLFVFPGCFGNDDPNTTTPVNPNAQILPFYQLADFTEFQLQVPTDWEKITEFDSKYPKNTILAFRNNVKDHDFIANINVVRNEVPEGTLSKDYALKMIETIAGQLVNFKELNRQEIPLLIGNTEMSTYLFECEGTNDAKAKNRRFIQLYGVKGTKAYIITGTYDSKDAEVAIDQVKTSVKTFTIK